MNFYKQGQLAAFEKVGVGDTAAGRIALRRIFDRNVVRAGGRGTQTQRLLAQQNVHRSAEALQRNVERTVQQLKHPFKDEGPFSRYAWETKLRPFDQADVKATQISKQLWNDLTRTGAMHGTILGAGVGALQGGEGNRLRGAAGGALGGAALGGLGSFGGAKLTGKIIPKIQGLAAKEKALYTPYAGAALGGIGGGITGGRLMRPNKE